MRAQTTSAIQITSKNPRNTHDYSLTCSQNMTPSRMILFPPADLGEEGYEPKPGPQLQPLLARPCGDWPKVERPGAGEGN